MQPGRHSGVNSHLGLGLAGYKGIFHFLDSFFYRNLLYI